MSLRGSEGETIKEIVSIIEQMPITFQKEMLKQLKLKKAFRVAKKIDKAANETISDFEIATIVHDYRKGKG